MNLLIKISLIAISLQISAFAANSNERRAAREKTEEISIQATIESIDLNTRQVVLRGMSGELVTITADNRIERLDEFEVGDIIEATYVSYLKAEFREPTADEKRFPIEVIDDGQIAGGDRDPGAAVGTIIKAIVTIEIINGVDNIVTIRGPQGNYLSLPVEDSELLRELNIGEVVIMTYGEAFALTLEKVK